MPLDFDDEPGDEGAIRTFHFRRSVRGAMEGVLRERDHKQGAENRAGGLCSRP